VFVTVIIHVSFPDRIGPDTIIDYLIAKIGTISLTDYQDYYSNEHVQLLEDAFFNSDSDRLDPAKFGDRAHLFKDQVLQESGLLTIAPFQLGIDSRVIYEFTGHDSLKSFFRVQKIIRELNKKEKIHFDRFKSLLEKEEVIDENITRFWLYFWPDNHHKVQFLLSILKQLTTEQPKTLELKIPVSLKELEIKPYTTRMIDLSPFDTMVGLNDTDADSMVKGLEEIMSKIQDQKFDDLEAKYLIGDFLAHNKDIFNPAPFFKRILADKKTGAGLKNRIVKICLQSELLPRALLHDTLSGLLKNPDPDLLEWRLESASLLLDYNIDSGNVIRTLIDFIPSAEVSHYWKYKTTKLLLDQDAESDDTLVKVLLDFLSIKAGAEIADREWKWKLEVAKMMFDKELARKKTVHVLLECLDAIKLPYWKIETFNLLFTQELEPNEKKHAVNALLSFISSTESDIDPFWNLKTGDLLLGLDLEKAERKRVVNSIVKFIASPRVDPEWKLRAAGKVFDSGIEQAEGRVVDLLVKLITSEGINPEWKIRTASQVTSISVISTTALNPTA